MRKAGGESETGLCGLSPAGLGIMGMSQTASEEGQKTWSSLSSSFSFAIAIAIATLLTIFRGWRTTYSENFALTPESLRSCQPAGSPSRLHGLIFTRARRYHSFPSFLPSFLPLSLSLSLSLLHFQFPQFYLPTPCYDVVVLPPPCQQTDLLIQSSPGARARCLGGRGR